MTILAILTKFCLKFANLVNFAISFFCFALSALFALSRSKVQIVQCHFFMNQPSLADKSLVVLIYS